MRLKRASVTKIRYLLSINLELVDVFATSYVREESYTVATNLLVREVGCVNNLALIEFGTMVGVFAAAISCKKRTFKVFRKRNKRRLIQKIKNKFRKNSNQ